MHPGNLPIDLFVFDRVPGLTVVFHDLHRTTATLPIDPEKITSSFSELMHK